MYLRLYPLTHTTRCMDELGRRPDEDATDFKPVIVMGATNRPDALDPALRRAG